MVMLVQIERLGYNMQGCTTILETFSNSIIEKLLKSK
jgi:hypothetical protein